MSSTCLLLSDSIISMRFVVAIVAVVAVVEGIICSHYWCLLSVNSHRFNQNRYQDDTLFIITSTQSKTYMIVGWTQFWNHHQVCYCLVDRRFVCGLSLCILNDQSLVDVHLLCVESIQCGQCPFACVWFDATFWTLLCVFVHRMSA